MTQVQLCELAGISRQTLHSLLTVPSTSPSLHTVFGLAKALEVHPVRLIQLLCEAQIDRWGALMPATTPGDKTAFLRDVSFPDGELVLPRQRFTKIWEMQNVGTVPWEDRWLKCMDEEVIVYATSGETLRIAQPLTPAYSRIPIPFTAPGEKVRLAVEFVAPELPGTVLSYWKATHQDGRLCFPRAKGVWVKVQVISLAEIGATDPA